MKILIFRSGAFGDTLVITPVIRYLRAQGHELVVVTSKRGMEVFKHNPHISKLIQHKEETPIDKLSENIEHLRKQFKCEKVIDFSESIEVSLSQHPRSPNYKLPKAERIARFNRNFYEYSFEHAGQKEETRNLPDNSGIFCGDDQSIFYRPELFFDKNELYDVRDDGRREASYFLKKDCFNILIGMSGSGSNKAWPWTEDLAHKLCKGFEDIHIITVGDEKCRLIEPELEGRITNLSGRIPMRMAMQMTGIVDLVIAPDTGIIHAAGCYDTPKICLLGHNTIECITKHFKNDYSIESDPELAPCSPCIFLIYDMKLQCPLNPITNSSICMADGIPVETVYNRVSEIYAQSQKRS